MSLRSYNVTAWLSNLLFQIGSNSKSISKWNGFHFTFNGIYLTFPFQSGSQTGSSGDGPGFVAESGCSRGTLQFMLGIVVWKKCTVTLVLDLCNEYLKLCCVSECLFVQRTICSAVVTLMRLSCSWLPVTETRCHWSQNKSDPSVGVCGDRETPPACFGRLWGGSVWGRELDSILSAPFQLRTAIIVSAGTLQIPLLTSSSLNAAVSRRICN